MRYLIVWGKHGWEVIDTENNCTVCTTARTWAEALQKKIALEDDTLDKKHFA